MWTEIFTISRWTLCVGSWNVEDLVIPTARHTSTPRQHCTMSSRMTVTICEFLCYIIPNFLYKLYHLRSWLFTFKLNIFTASLLHFLIIILQTFTSLRSPVYPRCRVFVHLLCTNCYDLKHRRNLLCQTLDVSLAVVYFKIAPELTWWLGTKLNPPK